MHDKYFMNNDFLCNLYCFDVKIYGKAIQAMERFYVVGIMEEFNISVELTFKRLQADRIPTSDEIPREREAVLRRKRRKEIILSNSNLIRRAAMNNLYDIQLYRFGVYLAILYVS